MNVFLTGGTGFIGSSLLRLLACKEGVLIKASRRNPITDEQSASGKISWVATQSLADISETDLIGIDVLVHAAAVGVSPKKASWEELLRVNVVESMLLCEKACNAGVNRLVLLGSCFEYGKSGERFQQIPPDAPLEPVSPYGASKAAVTMAAIAFSRDKSIAIDIVRPFHVYGESQSEENFWPMLRKAAVAGDDFAMTAGKQLRDFVSVNELSKQIHGVMTEQSAGPGRCRIRNLGSGRIMTLADFARGEWSAFNASGRLKIGSLPYRSNEVMSFVPDVKSIYLI